MKSYNFPYIALGLGLFLMLVVMKGSELGDEGHTNLPILTLLFVSEFAFFVTAIGGYIGIKKILAIGIKPVYLIITIFCVLLSIRFIVLGIGLWPVNGLMG